MTAYLIWGTFPIWFRQAEAASAWEVLAHRIIWSLVLCLIIAASLKQKIWHNDLRKPRVLLILLAASILIAGNWTVYVYGVNTGRVVETSLGYFINPLVSIAIGVLLLGEKLRRMQWVAVGLGATAVIVLSLQAGSFPWIAISLAVMFALYGLVKKYAGAHLTALGGMIAETTLMLPGAVVLVWYLHSTDQAAFGPDDIRVSAWLVALGALTAIPLLSFAAAVKRLPLSMIGLLQYLAPVLQFIVGVGLYREPMSPARWAGFCLVWVALMLLTYDGIRQRRQELASTSPGD